MAKKKHFDRRKIIFLAILIIIITTLTAYPFIVKKPFVCQDLACFKEKLSSCDKAEFVSDVDEATWIYTIIDKTKNECLVDQKLLQVKEGELSIAKLEGLSMTCETPLGTSILPGENLNECSGILKEEMQEIIIENLHKHIIENLGVIDQGLNSI